MFLDCEVMRSDQDLPPPPVLDEDKPMLRPPWTAFNSIQTLLFCSSPPGKQQYREGVGQDCSGRQGWLWWLLVPKHSFPWPCQVSSFLLARVGSQPWWQSKEWGLDLSSWRMEPANSTRVPLEQELLCYSNLVEFSTPKRILLMS